MKLVFFCILWAAGVPVPGQIFVFEKDLSAISFSIKNFGIPVTGSFKEINGNFILNELNPEDSHFHASVNVSTINTGIGLRDKHLKQKAYFHVGQFPDIHIVSKAITRTGVQWSSIASITIKGITREKSINFTVTKKSNYRVFTAMFVLNRLDFGIGESSFSLADSVEVRVQVVGVNPSEDSAR